MFMFPELYRNRDWSVRFPKLTVSMMKSKFLKLQPKMINYRQNKFFNNENFKIDLMHEIQCTESKNMDCEQLENLFTRTLHYHAPHKRRLV